MAFMRSLQSSSTLTVIPIVWILGMMLFFYNKTSVNVDPREIQMMQLEYKKFSERMSEANRQMEILLSQNNDLLQYLNELKVLKGKKADLILSKNYLKEKQLKFSLDQKVNNPSKDYELALRRIESNIDEMWFFLKTKLNSSMMNFVNEHRHNMFVDLKIIEDRDNHWRRKELQELGKFVEDRIFELQNPSNCADAKKLVCQLNKPCGFGCQMHHAAYCMIAAMAMGRTLIMDFDRWYKKGADAWMQVFQPLSKTCTDANGKNRTEWGHNENLQSYQVIDFPIIDDIEPRPSYLPLFIPSQISEKLITLHGDPFVWFIGQVLRFVMRPSPKTDKYINDFKKAINFRNPIVGLHVRRTDKIGTEASKHSLAEYMHFIDDFYNKIRVSNERHQKNDTINKIIYLATDEPNVWRNEILPYQRRGYKFIGDIKVSESAVPGIRSKIDSLRNIILDVNLLSECDFIVCTFSSQICRLAYELLQTRQSNSTVDFSRAGVSIDDAYYFGGQIFHGKIALANNVAKNDKEIDFKVGDILGIVNDYRNGYNFGRNFRTNKIGFYPRFKVTEYVQSEPFAVFN